MGFLVFRCRTTGKKFRSNFRATVEELKSLSPQATMALRCEVCQQRHSFDLAQCSIADNDAKADFSN